jgi:2',3'-cyclic-nucleotide 2'-phosphodiesterase (5'-nucleotidase family)
MLKFFRNPLYFILVFVSLAACKPHALITKVETNVITLDTIAVVKEDTSALRLIKPFREKMNATMDEVIAYSDQAMVKGTPEGVLNNFVSDLSLLISKKYYKPADSTTIDMCLLNMGGLRGSLPKGNITLGKVYELMPFENSLVVITLSGEKTKEMFDYIAKMGGMPIAGFTMGMKDTLAFDPTVNGKTFDITRSYKVVTSDYLAGGGDKMNFFKNPLKREDLSVKVRDAILEFMKDETKKGNTLKAKLDNRIHNEK